MYIIFKNSESSDDDDSDDESSEDEAAPVKKEAPKAKAEKGLLNKYLKTISRNAFKNFPKLVDSQIWDAIIQSNGIILNIPDIGEYSAIF